MPGGVYHIVSRGNARQDVFLDDGDRRRFLFTLRCVVERSNVLCHAYCLMSNHYHLLLETPDANISLAIRQLNGVYAQSFNRRHARVGHVFQGRFTSRLVEKDSHLLAVSRYIVLNPVRADLVRRAADWTWSSYRAQVGCCEPPSFLTVDWLLTCFDATDRRKAQRAYLRFVQEGLDGAEPLLEEVPILGRPSFVASFRERLRRVAPLKEIPRVHRFAARPTLREIFDGCTNRRDRNARIREAHVAHAYMMTEIARHLNLHPMTISRAVRGQVSHPNTPPADVGM